MEISETMEKSHLQKKNLSNKNDQGSENGDSDGG